MRYSWADEFNAGQHKNWPRFKPFLRHSISEDVAPERRGLVWRNYWAWVLGAAGFGWNWLIVTIMYAVLAVRVSHVSRVAGLSWL